jgi:hypothetical protein
MWTIGRYRWSASNIWRRQRSAPYQGDLRMFSEVVTDGPYGWATECEKAFGTYPVPIVHEWNTIAQLDVVD